MLFSLLCPHLREEAHGPHDEPSQLPHVWKKKEPAHLAYPLPTQGQKGEEAIPTMPPPEPGVALRSSGEVEAEAGAHGGYPP